LTIVGLGPGGATLLTREAIDTLAAADEVWLRTARHPTVAGLPQGPRYASFDDVYDRGASFEAVYGEIVARVWDLATRPQGVVYAVPGHPLFGEATTRGLIERARPSRASVRVVAGLSFLDVVATALGIDPLASGLLLLDALELAPGRRLLVPQRPTVIAQVYDRRAASQAKLALLEAYPPEHAVRIVRGTDGEVRETTLEQLDRDRGADAFDHLTTLYVPALPAIEDVRTFEGLRAVVAQLRNPAGGCPWDLEQTHASLKRFLLEEAYEAIDALDEGEPKRLAEELGDLLMQIVLHAQVAEDEGTFVIEDVIASITQKLVRRHPHVFGDVQVSGAEDVLRNWETLKQDERGDAPLLDAVPKAMPALAQAQSVQGRAAKAGFGMPDAAGGEGIDDVLARGDADAFGNALFALVGVARERGIDAEEALRLAVGRFRARVAEEESARRAGTRGAERS
jgi:tetrapyrrole methylase family protein/MazG family protein